MDLSDGSDAEDGGRVSEELNEDDLLGPSDDEEDVDVSNARGGRFSSRLSPESTGSQQSSNVLTQSVSVDAEEEFLDLALGDEGDELELNPCDSSTPGISPVKIKVHSTAGTPPPPETTAALEAVAVGHVHDQPPDSGIQAETEDHAESEEQEHEDDVPEVKQEILDDDDDEEKGERSRFLSERPPADGSKSSSSHIGNPQPIRTLGDHFRFGNQFRYGGGSRMRGNMRPHGMMQTNLHMRRGFRNGGTRMANHHQIHPSQQPDFRAPGPDIPVSQCSGQIFIDFNQPMQNQQQHHQPMLNHQQQQSQQKVQLPQPPAAAQPPPQQTPPQVQAPPTAPTTQRQGVGIVRPQQQMQPTVRPHPVQNRPMKQQRLNIPRATEERRNPFFPSGQPRPRNQFAPHQPFPPQPPPPQQHIEMRPPIFIPNQQPVFIPQHQPNFIPPNPQQPPMMGNFPYVGGPTGPGMMMMRPGPMDFNRFQGPNQGPPPMWLEPAPPFGGPPQFQGMPPGFFPPPHQLQMNGFPAEQHFMQEQAMHNMMGYGAPPQFQVHRAPVAPHAYEQPPPIMEPRRERERYDYDRDSEEDRRQDEYRKYASKRRSDEDEYRRSPAKQRRYEDSHYEEAKPKPSSSTPAPVDPRTAELAKIVGETKKEMGIDDEYMAKMEEQKRKRDEIMRKKGRKKEESSPAKKNSIYVNPAAFKGDLSLLSSQIQQEMKVSASRSQPNNPPPKPKPKTILRVTRNSKGDVIHMEKLLKVEKAKTTARS